MFTCRHQSDCSFWSLPAQSLSIGSLLVPMEESTSQQTQMIPISKALTCVSTFLTNLLPPCLTKLASGLGELVAAGSLCVELSQEIW